MELLYRRMFFYLEKKRTKNQADSGLSIIIGDGIPVREKKKLAKWKSQLYDRLVFIYFIDVTQIPL